MTVGRKVDVAAFALAVGILAAHPAVAALPIETAFTYQGTLSDNGGPVTNASPGCDFEFTLWDDPTAGSQIGGADVHSGVSVVDGIFTVTAGPPHCKVPRFFPGAPRPDRVL